MPEPKIVLVTGASSGIGLATALELLRAGHRVWAGARRQVEMAPIAAAGGRILPLDVADDDSMRAAVAQVLEAEGRIDALVNNAGQGTYGAVEEMPIEEARRLIEVNLIGLGRMTQLVLPAMRSRGLGTIVNISSVGGSIWTPLGAWYHAAKWGVEGFSHALRLEVAAFGIGVVLVAPGFIATDILGAAGRSASSTSGAGPYRGLAEGLVRAARPGRGSPPAVVAVAIRREIDAARPRTMVRPGQYAQVLPAVQRLLPHRAFDRLVRAFAG